MMIKAYDSDIWVDEDSILGTQVIPDSMGTGKFTVQLLMVFGLLDFAKSLDYSTAVALASSPVGSE